MASTRNVPVVYAITASNTSTSVLTEETGTDSTDRVLVVKRVNDDSAGGFINELGTVVYATGVVALKAVQHDTQADSYKADYQDAKAFERDADGTGSGTSSSRKGGSYSTATVGEELLGHVVARYRVGTSMPQSRTETFTPPAVTIDLCPHTRDVVVPGSVRFSWMGVEYEDFEGVVYRGRTSTDPGIAAGVIAYAAGTVLLDNYAIGTGVASQFTLISLWTERNPWRTASVFARTPEAPLLPGSLTFLALDAEGEQITATLDMNGTISSSRVRGQLLHETGELDLQFGSYELDSTLTPEQKQEWWYDPDDVGAVQSGRIWVPRPVDPASLRMNGVAFSYLPLDASVIGLDPVRLPPDGRVPMFRPGTYAVIAHALQIPAATYTPAQTVDCARTRLSAVWIVDANGRLVHEGWGVDLDAGLVEIEDPSDWAQPVVIHHQISQMLVVSSVQIDGTLTFTRQIAHDFPAGSMVCGALVAGDLRARAKPVWDQQTWDGVSWRDDVDPSKGPASASYNDSDYPVTVTNRGAITERWALRVLSGGSTVEVIGEHVGNLGVYPVTADIAPINPRTVTEDAPGVPYFTLRADGWGSGWAAQNVLFLSTVGAQQAFAAIRAVQPSEAAGTDYRFALGLHGDVDRDPS